MSLHLASFIPGLPSWRTVRLALVAAACIACFWAGISVRGWWAEKQEVQALKFQIERERKIARADQDSLKTLYESRLKIAQRPKVVRNEIVNLLPADCQLGPDIVGLLNTHRSDLPEASPGDADRSWLRWPDSR